MTTPAYYRTQAQRCRRLAGETHSREFAERLLETADEYLRLADSLESPLPSTPRHVEQPQQQQQQQQQQQIQSDTEKKE
jgi:hypothetical protein